MTLASKLIVWQKANGRNNLPWQVPDPYARLVSEIMLQQTQVATVLAYYERFMKAFPDVGALARAAEDEVMALWAGLGYYRRASNLHKAARIVSEDFGGRFPTSARELAGLPGVGPSTAAAVAAFAFGEREAIFDANVQRVFARLHAFGEPLSTQAARRRLFELVRRELPQEQMPEYTQAVMDLGALVCRKTPACGKCPLKERCKARALGNPRDYPASRAKKVRPVRERTFLLFWHDGDVYLERQNAPGVWRGLYVLPSFEGKLDEDEVILKANGVFSDVLNADERFCVTHDFSHYRLVMHVWTVRTRASHEGFFPAAGLPGTPSPITKVIGAFFA